MKIVRLMGGMGNQMFQYAFGVSVGKNTKYDISWFKEIQGHANITKREYELDFWNISPKLVDRHRKIFSFIRVKKIIENPYNIYNSKLLENKNCIFEGFFQVAKYYDNIREQLLKDFVPRNKPDSENQKMLDMINATNGVSLHIRRGDYVKLQHIHGLCGLDYYKDAINFIMENVASPYFYVFSDDIQWAKDNLRLNSPCEFIDFNHGRDSAWDIWLMSHCKHNIIANSSFSWWGAWLNQNPDKIVVAPKQWFANGDPTDIIPKEWTQI